MTLRDVWFALPAAWLVVSLVGLGLAVGLLGAVVRDEAEIRASGQNGMLLLIIRSRARYALMRVAHMAFGIFSAGTLAWTSPPSADEFPERLAFRIGLLAVLILSAVASALDFRDLNRVRQL